MKKIFTLMVAVATFAAVQAQTGSGSNRGTRQNDQRDNQGGYGNDNTVKDYPYDNDGRNNNGNAAFERNKKMRIAQINREYAFKIQKVKNSFFLSRYEKKRQIRFLEDQRQREIRRISISSGKNRNNDWNDHSNGRY